MTKEQHITEASLLARDPQGLESLCSLWKQSNKEVCVTLQGFSMGNTIPPGSRVKINCSPFEPKVGQVIAFRKEGSLYIHRVITLDKDSAGNVQSIICQGDANSKPDPIVNQDQIVGLVTSIIKPPQIHILITSLRKLLRPSYHKLKSFLSR